MTQRIVLNDQPNEVVINPTTLDVVVDEVTTPVTIAASGPQGIPGAAGATGAQGPQGPQGDPGEPGVIAATAPILYDAPTQTVSIDDTVFVGSNEKGAALGVATLDANGLIPTDQLPGVAITNTFVVGSQAAMLLLTAETGDVAVRTDVSKSFILTAEPASTLGNWQELISPTDAVQSVDGRTGTVTLSDIYDAAGTAASAVSTHNSNTTSVHGITNTANLVYTGDARLSDARTPLAHASSHGSAGSDAVTIAPSQLSAGGASASQALMYSGTAWAPNIYIPRRFDISLPPASPSAYDDEFRDATGQSGPVNGLAAKWTAINPVTGFTAATNDVTTIPGMLLNYATGAALNTGRFVLYQTYPSSTTEFEIVTQIFWRGTVSGVNGMSLFMARGNSFTEASPLINLQYHGNTSGQISLGNFPGATSVSPTSTAAVINASAYALASGWLKMRWRPSIGTYGTIDYAISTDGVNWFLAAQRTITSTDAFWPAGSNIYIGLFGRNLDGQTAARGSYQTAGMGVTSFRLTTGNSQAPKANW